MGYMYDKLKIALGGSKFSSSHQGIMKDWTPNGVKAIFICRDFILIANHVKPPKLYSLDIQEVMMDVQRNGSTGAMHNLLAQRQLSCLEEIYVDGMYQKYVGALNLEGYIQKLQNDKSRLRYYGYISGANPNEVLEKYNKAKLDGNPLYSYAGDSSRSAQIQYATVSNPTWYKNYNLRPQHYALDADNGVLARWFRKSESDIEKYISRQRENVENMAKSQILKVLIDYDKEGYTTLKKFLLLRKRLRRSTDSDYIRGVVLQGLSSLFDDKQQWKIRYLTLQWLRSTGIQLGNDYIDVLQAYSHLGVFDSIQGDSNPGVPIDSMKTLATEGQGFLILNSRLDAMCFQIAEKLKKHDKLLAATVLLEVEKIKNQDTLLATTVQLGVKNIEVPVGAFASTYLNHSLTLEGYWTFIRDICGWNEETFVKEFERSETN